MYLPAAYAPAPSIGTGMSPYSRAPLFSVALCVCVSLSLCSPPPPAPSLFHPFPPLRSKVLEDDRDRRSSRGAAQYYSDSEQLSVSPGSVSSASSAGALYSNLDIILGPFHHLGTISAAFLSAPPQAPRVYPTWCPYLSGADRCLQSNVVPDSHRFPPKKHFVFRSALPTAVDPLEIELELGLSTPSAGPGRPNAVLPNGRLVRPTGAGGDNLDFSRASSTSSMFYLGLAWFA